jgi:hypothetical protein
MDRAERRLYLQRGLLDARRDRPDGLEDRAEDILARTLDGLDGSRRYQPVPPPGTRRLHATRDGHRWTLERPPADR